MSQILVIYNPISGGRALRGSARAIQSFLKKEKIDYVWRETVHAKHQPLEEWITTHFDRIIVVGGDGTVREVAQYLIDHDLKIPLGIVAQGTGNVLAMSLGIPVFPLQRALSFALKQAPQPLDVLLVNRRYVGLIGAGQGYDALFIRSATRRLKRAVGAFAYVISFLRTFFFSAMHHYRFVVDGKREYATGRTIIILNILSVAGIPIDRTVSPCDGKLNVVVLNPRSLWDLSQIAWGWVRRHPIDRLPTVRTFTGKTVSVSQKHGKHVQVDGDVFPGRTLQVQLKYHALSLVYAKKFALL